MNCRICMNPLNTTHCRTYSLFDRVNVDGILVSVAGALREIFPNFQEVSNLDVPCIPTYICDRCLKFLVVSYKFYIRCYKTNLRIQNLLRGHKEAEKFNTIDANHPKHDPCLENGNKYSYYQDDASRIDETSYKTKVQSELEPCREIKLEVNYSLNSEISVLRYLQLQKNTLMEIEQITEDENSYDKRVAILTSNLRSDCNKFEMKTSKYQCIVCGKNFKTFQSLRKHLKVRHVWYRCKICQKQFLDNDKFELHVKKNHTGYRPFQCPICMKLFKTNLLFYEHEKYTHSHEKPYKCKYCNKKCTKLLDLDMHLRTHTGERCLTCQYCDDLFDDADSLEQHRKLSHTVRKVLHECDLCLAEFTNLTNLTKHMKTHKDSKPHCCVICDRQFPTLRLLKNHISIKHGQQEVLTCELCDTTYLNESDLMAHVEKHAGEF